MKNTRIASRYARALLDFAIEKDLLESCCDDMKLVSTVCSENRELVKMLQSPIIKTDKKRSIIKEIFGSSINELSLTFLDIIVRKGREADIPEISRQFIEIYKDYKHIYTVHLQTASAAGKEIKTSIEGLLKKAIDGSLEMHEDIDESLIGGFILRWGDNKYDASIKNQLSKLKRSFSKKIYIRNY